MLKDKKTMKEQEYDSNTQTDVNYQPDELNGHENIQPCNNSRTQVAENLDMLKEFSPKLLTPDDASYDTIMEKFVSAPTKPKYCFEEFGDYWSCSCGHINKGDYCKNCGLSKDLLKSLFILRKPGTKPPIQIEEKTEKPNEVIPATNDADKPKKKKSASKGIKILIAIFLILILGSTAGLFSYYYVIMPALEKEAAERNALTAECLKASISKCVNDFDTFLWNSYISAGDKCVKSKDFNDSIKFYRLAADIDKTDKLTKKIRNSKFEYVKAHASKGGSTFEEYLNDLYKINYSGIEEIYRKHYAWHIKIVANLEEDDYKTDIKTASRKDTVYFHVMVSGGPPDEDLYTYYEAKWPSGSTSTEDMGSNWRDGSKGTARFQYVVPLMGKEGKFTFKLFNKNTEELLESDSVIFEK